MTKDHRIRVLCVISSWDVVYTDLELTMWLELIAPLPQSPQVPGFQVCARTSSMYCFPAVPSIASQGLTG